MKFKQTDGQNQRIEQITTSHLVIGIDMAKETHVDSLQISEESSFQNGTYHFRIALKDS